MNELFPDMMDKPDGSMAGAGLAYILAAFLILPFFMLILVVDAYRSDEAQFWLEFGFHVLSAVVCFLVFRSHFEDSLITAQTDKKRFLSGTAIGLVLSVGVVMAAFNLLMILPQETDLFQAGMFFSIPMSEKNFVTYPLYMLHTHPVLATVCMTVLAPVSISCLYYGSCFAQVCYRKPWLAYPATALLIALPRIVNCMTFRWDSGFEMLQYCYQLPLHFLACYAYQKTDSILAPVIVHGSVNLMGCVAMLVLTIG